MQIFILLIYSESGMNRQQLDRRRLEEAHLKLCVLDVFNRYPEVFPKWLLNTDLRSSLNAITPLYYEAFSLKYAGKWGDIIIGCLWTL